MLKDRAAFVGAGAVVALHLVLAYLVVVGLIEI
jgi:hypothetical protein